MTRLNDLIFDAIASAYTASEDVVSEADIANAIEAALADATGGPDHVINVKRAAWTLQHPLHERFEENGANLFACKFSQLATTVAENVESDGRYRVWEDRGALLWEPLP